MTLTVALGAGWRAHLSGDGAVLSGPRGVALTYGQLYARDADGRHLPARLMVARDGDGTALLRITVAARGAAYPLTIDPMLQPTATLTPGDVPANWIGQSVAISADGSTVLAGAPGANVSRGVAFVFVRPSGGWSGATLPTATLAVNDVVIDSFLGWAVALSADGTTALIGAPGANGGAGAAYDLTLNNQPGQGQGPFSVTLTASGMAAGSQFGRSVALTPDGSTALVGAPGADEGAGAAYVFAQPRATGADAITPTAALTSSGLGSGSAFGASVALSADGATALIGAPTAHDAGAAYAYARPAAGWSDMGAPTAALAAGLRDGSAFGTAVALSDDGAIALIGAPGADRRAGVAALFMRPHGAWAGTISPAALLTDGTLGAGSAFGSTVALSSGGSIALIGADTAGAACLFVRPSVGWASSTTPDEVLGASGSGTGSRLGGSVALAADGATALVGAGGFDGTAGAAYVYAQPSGGWHGMASASMPVSAGWNAIAPRLQPATPLYASRALAELLTATGGRLASIYALSDGRWRSVLADLDGTIAGTDFTLSVGAGYLLYSDRAGNYPDTGAPVGSPGWSFASGWTLVGVPALPPAPYVLDARLALRALLSGTRGGVAALYAMSDGQWRPGLFDVNGTVSGTDFPLLPGHGYLLYSDTAGSLQPLVAGARRARPLAVRGGSTPPASLPTPPPVPGA